jgi:hypothetical protein
VSVLSASVYQRFRSGRRHVLAKRRARYRL